MRLLVIPDLRVGFFCVLLLARLITPSLAYLNVGSGTEKFTVHPFVAARPATQSSNLKILGPDKKPNPVVNEGKTLNLIAVDSNNQSVNGVTWESSSKDIATVDPTTGVVTGLQRGFTTITARTATDSASTFVVVTKVEKNAVKVISSLSQLAIDTSNQIYISKPGSSFIVRKDGPGGAEEDFAGLEGDCGNTNGQRTGARFCGPTALTVDNRAVEGGIYVADTLNHSIRKISFNGQVTTVLGTGSPGRNNNDVTKITQPSDVAFDSPLGVVADNGNLYIADTENHAIYFVDLGKKEVRLLAGQPGTSGRADGVGRNAQFNRPAGLAISPVNEKEKILTVADMGNKRVRSITIPDGVVTTMPPPALGNAGTQVGTQALGNIEFDMPQSVSFDATGNLYVADRQGVSVVTLAAGPNAQVVPLAQPGTFMQPASVLVSGTATFVLDAGASPEEALKVVTVGAPEITNLSKDTAHLEGGEEIVITGKNFAPESQVILGDSVATDVRVVSDIEIRFIVPLQNLPGGRTLTVRTRGGIAQSVFGVMAKPLPELLDGEITTVVGGVPFLGDGGLAVNASLNRPSSVAVDGAGNLFISDSENNRIRRLDTSGVIITVAGNGIRDFTGDGGPAISASLNFPTAVAVDRAGDLFIADSGSSRIRRVDGRTGIITTAAGNGTQDFSGDNGPATGAGLTPVDVAVDGAGNLLIADGLRVRRVVAGTGIITTVAGNGRRYFSGDDGPATSAGLTAESVAVDGMGNLFITDSFNQRIRQVDAETKAITTVAGTGFAEFSGDGGQAITASLNFPRDVVVDEAGNLFIADGDNNRIRRVDAKTNIITTVAGSGPVGPAEGSFSGDGGPATIARLSQPASLAIDGVGNLFIADSANNRIRRVDVGTRVISTVAGNGMQNILGDGGLATSASLNLPKGMAIDKAGNLFISDFSNHRVRRVDAKTSIITTVAGNEVAGFKGDGGLATNASLSNPTGVAVDVDGNLFIADAGNNRIRRVDASTGIITTLVGTGTAEFSGDDGPASKAGLKGPSGLAIDRVGNLLIVDSGNNRIRLVDAKTNFISTIVGNGDSRFSGDGGLATKAGIDPESVALDEAGNLFIADGANNRIRRVDASTGIITTVAGNGTKGFSGEGGPATSASLNLFFGGSVVVDGAGNLFIADLFNQRIRRVDVTTGIITTVAGNGNTEFSGDGGLAISAGLNFPTNVAVNETGNLFIADTLNNAIRAVKVGRPVADFALSINPVSQSVSAGESINFTIDILGLNGFIDPVDLSARMSPFDSSIMINLSAKTITPGSRATMMVSTTTSTPLSTFNITVMGISGRLAHNQTVSLTVIKNGVVDFELVVDPPKQTVSPGLSTIFKVNVKALNGFSQLVNLSAVPDPPSSSVTVCISPSNVMPDSSADMTVKTMSNASGTFLIRVTGKANQLEHTKIVTLIVANLPPTIASIANQTVKAGSVVTVPVSSSDPNGPAGLRLSIQTSLPFVSLSDNFNGTGTIRIAPALSDTQGGQVTVTVTDPGGLTASTSFNVTVQKAVQITAASLAKPNLFISGFGFGSSGATVSVNGTNVSARIIGQTDNSITLKGSKRKLNLKSGANQITVTASGVTSNTFVLNLITKDVSLW